MVSREGECVGGVEGSAGSVMWSRTNQLSVSLAEREGKNMMLYLLRMMRRKTQELRWLMSGERRRERGRGSEEEQGRRAEDLSGTLPNRLCRAAQQTTKRDGDLKPPQLQHYGEDSTPHSQSLQINCDMSTAGNPKVQ